MGASVLMGKGQFLRWLFMCNKGLVWVQKLEFVHNIQTGLVLSWVPQY